MSFDREYKHRKDWRKPYLGTTSKNADASCRPHGSCYYCRSNRLHSQAKAEVSTLERLQEFAWVDQPDREQPPQPRKNVSKRWGIEFYSPWFGRWKIHRWYSAAEERDRALARLETNKAMDRNGRLLRYRKTKR